MKRIIIVAVAAAFLMPILFTSSLAVDAPLKCASLTGCGDWSECPGRGREIQRCVRDCENGPIVFCPGYQG